MDLILTDRDFPFEKQDRILSMEIRQTRTRQGIDTFNVSAVTKNDVPKSYQFGVNQKEKVQYFEKLAEELGIEITYQPHLPLPISPVMEEHDTFNTPPDEQVIWRYMSFSKFMSLISSESLWFARADTLQASDPMEGRVPEAQVEANIKHLRLLNLAPMTDKEGRIIFSPQQRAEQDAVMHMRREYFERYKTYINCWHISDVENFAMWRIYGEESNSLAIKSTVGDLRKALGESDNYRIFAGAMNYVDYSDPAIFKEPMPNGFSKYLNKSQYYEYEKELRLIYWDIGDVSDLIPNEVKYHIEPDESDVKEIPTGVKVPIDFKQLVNEVILGPDCEPWFIEMLQGLNKQENSVKLIEILGLLNIKLSDVKGYRIPGPPNYNW